MNYTRRKALLIIALSTLLVTGSCSIAYLLFEIKSKRGRENSKYTIKHIIQKSSRFEALKNSCLTEFLGLSKDQPQNIYQYDCKEGINLLKASHVIEKAEITKLKPDALLIDYEVREPFAIFPELTNTYLDKTGTLFPAYPYYTPKRLPEVLIGGLKMKWGEKINEKKLELVFSLMEHLKNVKILRIDLSKMDQEGLGQKEIVVAARIKKGVQLIRLPVSRLFEALEHYKILTRSKGDLKGIIDLRLVDIAYINGD